MKITCVGWYGNRNVGDEAFREVFKSKFDGHDLAFTEVPSRGHEKPDLIVYGGGGVLAGSYLKGVPKNTPIIAMGVDMALSGRHFEAWKDLNFDVTYVRSKEYAYLATDRGFNVHYCPDLAFALVPPKAKIKPPGKMRLGITLTSLIYPHHCYYQFERALLELKQEYDLYTLPFYDNRETDTSVHLDYLKHIPGITDLGWSSSSREHFEKIQSLDALITMRFHGTIFATLCGVPFVSMTSRGKDSYFCEQEGLHTSHVNLHGMNYYRILDGIGHFKDKGHKLSAKLKKISAKNRAELAEVFKSVEATYLTG